LIDNKYLTINETKVKVTQKVSIIKEVMLDISIVEGNGLSRADVEIEMIPSSVFLVGEPDIVSGINSIELGPINLSNINQEYQEYNAKLAIPLPNDVRTLSGITEAEVRIVIKNLELRPFVFTNIIPINVLPSRTATVLTESIVITLRGRPENLEQVDLAILSVEVDVENKVAIGTHELTNIKVVPSALPTGVSMMSGDYRVLVKIE